jgi:hypothetical protein
LKYDSGIFFGLYNNSPSSHGVEPYPEGTSVLIDNIQGTVISVPSPALDRQLPASDNISSYVIRLVAKTATTSNDNTTNIIQISTSETPSCIPNPSPWDNSFSAPSWIGNDKKVTFLHAGEYHKGFLEFTDTHSLGDSHVAAETVSKNGG